MKTVKVLIQIPESLKHYLDVLRREGYTASGYIRGLLERDVRAREQAGWSASMGWPQLSQSEFEKAVKRGKPQDARRRSRRAAQKGR